MKAYPLFVLTLLASSLAPKGNITPVYAEGESSPSTITIIPTGLNSCDVNRDIDGIATYSLTNPDPSKLSTADYLPNNSTATYSLEGLGGINISKVSFSAKTPAGNPSFNLDYYLNEGERNRVFSNFESLFGKQSDDYVNLTAPFVYPLKDVAEFRFAITVTGVMNVQSVTITYEEGMDPFAKAMLSDLTCDESGSTPPSVEEWNAAKDAFETLSVEEQGKYKDAQADATGDTYQRVVAKYDYILSKYGTEEYENFLGRAVADSPVIATYDNSNLIALAGLILIGIAATGFLAFSRKFGNFGC